MIRFIYYTILFLSINSCANGQKTETLEIIIYNKFVDPQKEFDALIEDFMATRLVDSLKILGRPIKTPSIKFEIDTLRATQLGISLNLAEENLKNIYQLKNTDEILNQSIVNESGQKIPISLFCKIYMKWEYYKPKIFIPNPEIYNYKDRSVVKIEFYLKNNNKKRLIEFINSYIHSGPINKWEIEIIN